MGDYIKTVGIWIVAIAGIVFTLNYILTNVQINNQNQAIEETLQTTLLANQQYSERVEKKTFYLDKPKFEQAFLNNFTKNNKKQILDHIFNESKSALEIVNSSFNIEFIGNKIVTMAMKTIRPILNKEEVLKSKIKMPPSAR